MTARKANGVATRADLAFLREVGEIGGGRWPTSDAAYRLTNERRVVDGTPKFNVTYTYDAAGNRLTMNNGAAVTTYTYSDADKLLSEQVGSAVTTHSYDAAGNRTKVEMPGETRYYEYDAPGRLTEVTVPAGTVTFTYNADGQRVGKEGYDATTEGFVYDGANLLERTDGAGGMEASYTAMIDEPFGDLLSEYDDGDGEELDHEYDGQWNTNGLLDPAGDAAGPFPYTAFGLVPAGGPAAATPLAFGGQKQYYRDEETDLYLLGGGSGDGRYYDPHVGRFISEDPLRQAGGDNNPFVYVGNDPVNNIDPSGQLTPAQLGQTQGCYQRPSTIQCHAPQGSTGAFNLNALSGGGENSFAALIERWKSIEDEQNAADARRIKEEWGPGGAKRVEYERRQAQFWAEMDASHRLRPGPQLNALSPRQAAVAERIRRLEVVEGVTMGEVMARKANGVSTRADLAFLREVDEIDARAVADERLANMTYGERLTAMFSQHPQQQHPGIANIHDLPVFAAAKQGQALGEARNAAASARMVELERAAQRSAVRGSPTVPDTRVPPRRTSRILRYVGPDVWESPGRLRYAGRDPDGLTRVQHVLRHAADDPARGGAHGVFDAGRSGALQVLDEAWALAQRGGRNVRVDPQGNRTRYIIDMGRRIGYVGGQAGAMSGNPPANHILIIIANGNEVITAFPLIPR